MIYYPRENIYSSAPGPEAADPVDPDRPDRLRLHDGGGHGGEIRLLLLPARPAARGRRLLRQDDRGHRRVQRRLQRHEVLGVGGGRPRGGFNLIERGDVFQYWKMCDLTESVGFNVR